MSKQRNKRLFCDAAGCRNEPMDESDLCGFHDEEAETKHVTRKTDRCAAVSNTLHRPCLLPASMGSEFCHIHMMVQAKRRTAA